MNTVSFDVRFRFLSRIVLVALVAGTVGISTDLMAQLKDATELKTAIQAEREAFGATEPLNVRFTLTNSSGSTLHVLKWATPLEGFTGDIFRVDRGGKPVPYIGRLVKRGAPTPDEYVTIAPGESVSATIDLAEGYAIYDSGEYSVEFNSRILDYGREAPGVLAAKKTFSPKDVRSNAVKFSLREQKQPLPKPAEGTPEGAAKQPAFKNCSQSQQTTLNQALPGADNLAVLSQLVIYTTPDSKKSTCARYKTWFGTYASSRWDTVKTHYDKIHDALANKTITFHCDCNQNWYAYVYANQPYDIWLCKAFWSAPATGTDSQAGTIVHETSHFTVVAGTSDHAYGQSNCQSLAVNDPSKAVQNADSHEYFAENTPSKTCGLEQVPLSLVVILLVPLGDRLIRKKL